MHPGLLSWRLDSSGDYHHAECSGLFLSLSASCGAIMLKRSVVDSEGILVRRLGSNAGCLLFLYHRASHSLFCLFSRRRSINHLLALEEDVVHSWRGVNWHASTNSVDIVCAHWNFWRVDKLVNANNSHHVPRNSSDLFASYLLAELRWTLVILGS